MIKVLIVDDDIKMCNVLSRMLKHIGYDATCTFTLQDGLKKASSETFDVVFLDVMMPDGSGLDILPRIKETFSSPEVIIMTGKGDPDGAELAIQHGAWDYIEKPSSLEKMTQPLISAVQYREEKKARKPAAALKRDGIIGNSKQMKASFDLLIQAANSDANVLVSGETGTGKELFAFAIHDNSSRADRNFVVVDCASLPESLVESALFGYEKGAFTGADKAQDGLIKQADGGTLFLDEVGELPLSLQKAFLRVLQERRFRPLGGKREIESNFRLVAATNRDLDEMVKQGKFRKDLLFRLRSLPIELSPLRERPDDIKELTIYHTDRLCERYGIGPKNLSPEFLEVLATYDWPGNVRELINTLERALATARHDKTLFHGHLPNHIRIQAARASVSKQFQFKDEPENITNRAERLPELREFRDSTIASAEKKYLHQLMSTTKGGIKQATRI
ncbi:MAG: sigma-54-dependent Fis family transcriptional regulator, partial [Deltaproteobacteria bacterium]|nr:sigma-54-dependent Fis family transcriptional regulator [Deltaproteobacteria bacterium]